MLPYPRWMRHRVRRGCCRTASGLHKRRQQCMLCLPEFDCDTWVLFTLKDSCICSRVYVITFNSQMGGVVCRPWWLVDSCRLLLSLCVLSLFKFCSKHLLQNWWSALSSFQDVRVSDRAGHANPVVTEQMTDDTQRSPFLISSHSDLCCDHISSALAMCWQGGGSGGTGVELELPCSSSYLADLSCCRGKTAVGNLRAAAVIWELLRVSGFYKQRSPPKLHLWLTSSSVRP